MIKIPKMSDEKTELFATYSRLEFALKECHYVVREPGIAHVDWKRFAEEACLKDVLDVAKSDADVREMIKQPPAVQITDGEGSWSWDKNNVQPITSLRLFFEAVKQVRDNLFHGGKSGEDPRDDTLCRAACKVLALCLERQDDVRAMFEGRY